MRAEKPTRLCRQIGKPGATSFSLTGQPNACGGVRDTGSLSHILPYGRGVANEGGGGARAAAGSAGGLLLALLSLTLFGCASRGPEWVASFFGAPTSSRPWRSPARYREP